MSDPSTEERPATLPLEPGRYEDIPIEEYHAHPSLNSSKLGLLGRSPAHLKASADWPEEPTPAMVLGNAIHTTVLEPDELDQRYSSEQPEKPGGKMFDRRTKAGKENYSLWQDQVLDPWLLENRGKAQIPTADWNRLGDIRAAVMRSPAAKHVIGLGLHESSFIWEDPETGILCRCRPDTCGEGRGLLVDLKSTMDARPDPFSLSISRFRYYGQAAWYIDGVNAVLGVGTIKSFVFVAVEKLPPYGVGVYVLDPADVERGRAENRRALNRLAWCRERDEWPGYGVKITPIGLPRWKRQSLDVGEPAR